MKRMTFSCWLIIKKELVMFMLFVLNCQGLGREVVRPTGPEGLQDFFKLQRSPRGGNDVSLLIRSSTKESQSARSDPS